MPRQPGGPRARVARGARRGRVARWGPSPNLRRERGGRVRRRRGLSSLWPLRPGTFLPGELGKQCARGRWRDDGAASGRSLDHPVGGSCPRTPVLRVEVPSLRVTRRGETARAPSEGSVCLWPRGFCARPRVQAGGGPARCLPRMPLGSLRLQPSLNHPVTSGASLSVTAEFPGGWIVGSVFA